MENYKAKFVKIPRYNANHEVLKYETHDIPELIVPALKEIRAYIKAYGQMKMAITKLQPAMIEAFKSKSVDDLIDVGDFLSKLHIFSAHYFFERAFKLDPSKMNK